MKIPSIQLCLSFILICLIVACGTPNKNPQSSQQSSVSPQGSEPAKMHIFLLSYGSSTQSIAQAVSTVRAVLLDFGFDTKLVKLYRFSIETGAYYLLEGPTVPQSSAAPLGIPLPDGYCRLYTDMQQAIHGSGGSSWGYKADILPAQGANTFRLEISPLIEIFNGSGRTTGTSWIPPNMIEIVMEIGKRLHSEILTQQGKPLDPSEYLPRNNCASQINYTVKPGDTLIRIALDHNESWRDILHWNNLDDPKGLVVGQVLRVNRPCK